MKIAIAAEIYSPNLGDGVIYNCLKYAFRSRGIEVVPLDLSGRSDWAREAELSRAKVAERRARGTSTTILNIFMAVPRALMRRSRAARRLYSGASWCLWRRRSSVTRWERLIRDVDAVVIGGGELLTDRDFGFPPRIFEIARISKRLGKPLCFLGCGVGSHWGFVASRLYQNALGNAVFISVRGDQSALRLKAKLKLERAPAVHPDPAFLTPLAFDATQARAVGDAVGLVVQPAAFFRQSQSAKSQISDRIYFGFWLRLARALIDSGEQVFVQTNGDPADQKFATRLVREAVARGLNLELDVRPRQPCELVAALARYKTVICTRMHAGIIAHALGAHTGTIVWDKKISEVWRLVGQDQRAIESTIFWETDPTLFISNKLASVRGSTLESIQAEIASGVDDCIRAINADRVARA